MFNWNTVIWNISDTDSWSALFLSIIFKWPLSRSYLLSPCAIENMKWEDSHAVVNHLFLLPKVEATSPIWTLSPWDKTESLWKFLQQDLLLAIWENSSIKINLFLSLSLWHLCGFHYNHIFLIINLALLPFSLAIHTVSSTAFPWFECLFTFLIFQNFHLSGLLSSFHDSFLSNVPYVQHWLTGRQHIHCCAMQEGLLVSPEETTTKRLETSGKMVSCEEHRSCKL